jgi:hypothetical protein
MVAELFPPPETPTVERIVRDAMPAPDRRPTSEWAAENVDFGNTEAFKGNYNVENVPWVKGLLDALDNPRVRKVSFIGPPQESGKTKAAETFLCSRICRAPAKIAFNSVTNEKAGQWSDTRWKQMIGTKEIKAACKAVAERFTDNRHDQKRRRILFKDGSWLICQGAELDANRQSDSVEVQVNDECQLWLAPWMTQMHARTRAFRETRKILNIGLGGVKGSEWQTEWQEGSQCEWSHHCPACDKLFQYRFNYRDPAGSNIHFDKTKVQILTDGTIDFTEFRPTVFVTCPHCSARIDYDEDRIARMNLESLRRGDGWVVQNLGADPEHVSMHVNAFAIGRRPWCQIVEPFIRATMGRSVFATQLLKQFITEELCEFWEERPIVVRKEIAKGEFTRREMRDPKFWRDEWIRLLAFDNQAGGQGDIPHRWFVCRAFAKDGRSRLVDCGRLNEWESCESKRVELGVPSWTAELPGPWTFCDRWHNPQEVDEQCAKYKWFGIMGSDTDEFLHGSGSPWEGQKMPFSDERVYNLGFGKSGEQLDKLTQEGGLVACYYLYAKQKIEEILATLRSGKAEEFLAPHDIDEFAPEYAVHMSSHHQVMENTKNGDRLMWRGIGHAPDHMLDCETELVVGGLMAGIFKR